eukprot:31435-Pelagococcus_subviridis.AAC.4
MRSVPTSRVSVDFRRALDRSRVLDPPPRVLSESHGCFASAVDAVGRSASFGASKDAMRRVNRAGVDGGIRGSVPRCISSCTAVSLSGGGSPVSNTMSSTPTDHTSDLAPYASPRHISGAANSFAPFSPSGKSRSVSFRSPRANAALPKSTRTTLGGSDFFHSRFSMTLSGTTWR